MVAQTIYHITTAEPRAGRIQSAASQFRPTCCDAGRVQVFLCGSTPNRQEAVSTEPLSEFFKAEYDPEIQDGQTAKLKIQTSRQPTQPQGGGT